MCCGPHLGSGAARILEPSNMVLQHVIRGFAPEPLDLSIVSNKHIGSTYCVATHSTHFILITPPAGTYCSLHFTDGQAEAGRP